MKHYLLSLSLFISLNSYADSSTKSVEVNAKINGTCEISTSNINIGEIVPGQPSTSGTGEFKIKCSKQTSYKYYVGLLSWGADCQILTGGSKKEKLRYGIDNVTRGTYMANSPTGNSPDAGAIALSGIGTGDSEAIIMKATIQPSYQAAWSCPTPMKYPGSGYNPYVSPDTYSDTVIFGIIY